MILSTYQRRALKETLRIGGFYGGRKLANILEAKLGIRFQGENVRYEGTFNYPMCPESDWKPIIEKALK